MALERDTLMQEEFDKLGSDFAEDTDDGLEDGLEDDEGIEVEVSEDGDDEVDVAAIEAELLAKEELTAADLRRLPGSGKYTDEQLEQMWQEAINPPPPKPLPFKLYKGEDLVEDVDKLTARELLEMQLGYSAMGKEQRKSFEDLIRVAQYGHYNESKVSQIMAERQQVYEKYAEAQKELEQSKQDRKLWEYAIGQMAAGNNQPMAELIKAYSEAMSQPPAPSQQPNDMASNEAGMRVYYEYIMPNGYKIAEQYGANPEEVTNAILQLVANEPPEFMTPQKLENIINVEVPRLLEQNGYSANSQSSQGSNDEVAQLKKELAELKAKQNNQEVTAIKNKRRNAPSVGGGSPGSAGKSMKAITDRASMKEYLQSDD